MSAPHSPCARALWRGRAWPWKQSCDPGLHLAPDQEELEDPDLPRSPSRCPHGLEVTERLCCSMQLLSARTPAAGFRALAERYRSRCQGPALAPQQLPPPELAQLFLPGASPAPPQPLWLQQRPCPRRQWQRGHPVLVLPPSAWQPWPAPGLVFAARPPPAIGPPALAAVESVLQPVQEPLWRWPQTVPQARPAQLARRQCLPSLPPLRLVLLWLPRAQGAVLQLRPPRARLQQLGTAGRSLSSLGSPRKSRQRQTPLPTVLHEPA
mmetsp:Transcript_53002/g.118908  ORF Transcript_53002/g.118908 Transcript_53002/m.118908 type:complete len:266 (-) Transcript_53002:146-943(-)